MNTSPSKRSNIHGDAHSTQAPELRRQYLHLLVLWVAVLATALWSLNGWSQELQAQEETATTAPAQTATLPPTSTLIPTLTLTSPLTSTPNTTSVLEISPLAPSSTAVSPTGDIPFLTHTPVASSATATTTPTIPLGTISITATIWAKATATAQAIATLTAVPNLTGVPTFTPTPSPTPDADQLLDQQIIEMIAQMSVADRVGQLFVVEFQGNRIDSESAITELIQDYRIGGAVLSPANGNFSNEDPNAPREIAILTNQLQALAYDVVLPANQALDPPELLLNGPNTLGFNLLQQESPNIPLLIGVEQHGDGLPSSAMRSGFTTLPPQMAIGATWNPDLARQIGSIVGRELAAVGVNLVLGPNLDVLDQPRPEPVGSLGIYNFGGDSYWVGSMGQAYITGVHQGGQGRVATIASHFPGQGGSDRRPDEEVATIQKSLQELRHIELLPFASVTQRPSVLLHSDGDPSATDGLMSGHIRYSSFQGSRERTPPISLAKELGTILELEEFATWRQGGGVVMSDALGVSSIRRYYDPTLQDFPRKRIALEAFLAGNDLLNLGNFSLTGDWTEVRNNIRETVIFFRERYTSDPDFAARVDSALQRILRLKLGLYADKGEDVSVISTELPLEQVLTNSRALRVLGGAAREDAQAVVSQVAREAVTILYPDPRGLADPLPAAPQPGEKILIISDSRIYRECAACSTQPAISSTALEETMLQLYGPDATGQLQTQQLQSLTFTELTALLNDTASPTDVQTTETAIAEADWLIFAMLDIDVARYENSDAVKQFLRLRSDRLRGKRIVVLALNAPYFLDSTEISKLTTYLGVYGKTQPFLEAAVQTIFRAVQATGAPPVSVPGTQYSNLIERLEPDPDQTIGLHLYNKGLDGLLVDPTVESGAPPADSIQADLEIGHVIAVETETILDYNGNPVPDGTLVNFRLIYEGADLALPMDPEPTYNGKARIDVPLERSGTLRISASSVDASTSTIVVVSTQENDGAASIEFVMPPATPEPAVIASLDSAVALNEGSPETEGMATVAGPGAVAAEGTAAAAIPRVRVNLLTLGLALITQMVMLGLLLVVLVRVMPRTMLVYRMLWALSIGWTAYILYGLGLVPGSTWLQNSLYPWGVIPVVFIGMLLPMVWLQLRTE